MVDALAQRAEVTAPEKSNPTGGKIAGAALGVGLAAYKWPKSKKNINIADEFYSSDKMKAAAGSNNLDEVIKVINESKLDAKGKSKMIECFKALHEQNILKDSIENLTKATSISKKYFTPIAVALSALTVLLGVGLGAIVDHFRKDD